MTRPQSVWQDGEQSKFFLTRVRASMPMVEEMTELALRVIEAYNPRPLSVLDIGCGGGALGGAALARWPGAHALFTDYSETMIKECRAAMAVYGDRAKFHMDDFSLPGWERNISQFGPFDVILSGFAIHHQPDQRKKEIYAAIFQTLKPGGVFMHMEHVASRFHHGEELFKRMYRERIYARAEKESWGLSRPELDAILDKRSHKDENLLAPVEDQLVWLRDTGFAEVDVYFKVTELALFGGIKPL